MVSTPRGLHLGYFYDDNEKRAGGRRIYQGDTHALIFGPSGSGKTTRLLMANLLSDCLDDRSVVVIDPKGELAAVTAWHRFATLGHDVKILDPFGKLHEIVRSSPMHRDLVASGLTASAGFNPLDALDPGTEEDPNPNFYDDAAALGEALIKIEGKEPHWSESAQGLVVALLMWEKIRNQKRATLENVRKLLTEADEFVQETGPDGKPVMKQVKGLRVTAAHMVALGGYEIASLAARFMHESREIASIRSAGDTQTRWILSSRVRADLEKSGVDFQQLKEKPTTVYVILPAERMRTHSVWLRLVIVSALRALYRPSGLRTFFLIDEMAALGHLGPLEDAFGLVRGYGIQIAGFLQDLVQLKALYPERYESFMANAGVVQFFSANDLTTADWMSRRSGQTTVLADSLNTGTSMSPGGWQSSEGLSTSQVGRQKFMPYEVMGLGEGMGLYWLAGLSETVRFFAPRYSRIHECDGRDLPNPYRRT
jgi:type IV secretion system protein VirD4